jgi:hypothetical protein
MTAHEEVPTRVVLYSYAARTPEAVAEFLWSPGSEVSLTVLDPEQGRVAQQYYDEGVPFDAEQRLVHREEAATFMRALVQPRRTTYSQFVDESPTRGKGS